jgi:dipeptidyl aminopeptidase/acylaminoacyl peptidase
VARMGGPHPLRAALVARRKGSPVRLRASPSSTGPETMSSLRARGLRVVFVAAGIAALSLTAFASARTSVREVAGGQLAFLRNGRLHFVNGDGSGHRGSSLGGLYATPRWSPDGRKIAFYVPGGGTRASRILVANADGSRRREIVRAGRYDSCLDPVWSPDGKKLVYTVDCELDFMSIFVVNRDGTGRRKLTPGNWSLDPAWRPKSRTILFMSSPRGPARGISFRLFLMNADGSKRRRILGDYPGPDPSRLGEGPGAEWSPDGKEIFFLSGRALYAMKANGTQVRKLTPAGMTMGNFELSPDGRMVAASGAERGAREIYVLNADGTGLKRLTENRVHERSPTWSPDGRRIAFMSERDGNSEIYVMNADGSEQTNITRSPAPDELPRWYRRAADSRRLSLKWSREDPRPCRRRRYRRPLDGMREYQDGHEDRHRGRRGEARGGSTYGARRVRLHQVDDAEGRRLRDAFRSCLVSHGRNGERCRCRGRRCGAGRAGPERQLPS